MISVQRTDKSGAPEPRSAGDLAIHAAGLRKRYGDTEALAGVDLAVPRGDVCGLLGPNGAGKTTAVRILTTLARFDAGEATVAGHDVRREPGLVRSRIGLVGQSTAVDEVLSGRQNLTMFGRLYHLDPASARRRAGELLDRFALADAGDKPVREYSGGMRRRLDLAASLILAPPVLFLDEPTTGLDPRGRNEVWQSIRELVAGGTTVLLTTQYLEEADQLADQISVIDRGRVIANGSPAELKSRLGGDHIDVVVHDAGQLAAAAAIVARVAGAEVESDVDKRLVSAAVREPGSASEPGSAALREPMTAPRRAPMTALTEVVRALGDADIAAEDIALRRPTLDEVFLHLTGTEPRDTEEVAA
jgi:ABC-2 type transport system ATP-binding protein